MNINELIKDKWYTTIYWRSNSYAKFVCKKNGEFVMSERVYADEYIKGTHSWGNAGPFSEVSVNEIRKYLPKDYKFDNVINYYFW